MTTSNTRAKGVGLWLARKPSGQRLGNICSSRVNNFDLIRLFAATVVITEHSFVLASGKATNAASAAGTFGVAIFFSLSGYLIAKSWLRDPSPIRFLTKRFLRIMPALVATTLLAAFLLGPVVTTLRFGEYLKHPATWNYVINNARMFPITHKLPGVFISNPFPASVNISLWTLPIEALAYSAALVLGLSVCSATAGRCLSS